MQKQKPMLRSYITKKPEDDKSKTKETAGSSDSNGIHLPTGVARCLYYTTREINLSVVLVI